MTPPAARRIACIRRPGIRAWLDTASPFASALEAQLERIVSVPSAFTPIPTRNRMNKVWEGPLPNLPGTYILKLGWCNPVYHLDRRIARRVNMSLQNRFLRSMELSFRLDAIHFPAIRPILCWKKIPRLLPTEIGILYPKIEASSSLFRYLDTPADRPWAFRGLPPETARAWGRHTRRLNEAGLLHIDPAPQNILLRPGAATPPTEPDFIYIDTDAFRPLPVRDPASPLGRWHRALAMHRAMHLFTPNDLVAFCEGFALPSESPAAWIRLLDCVRRIPRLHPYEKLLLLFRAFSFRD